MNCELHNITKSFTDGTNGTRQVLRGINLSLSEGDFVAITGVSGSGKTTLLNILGAFMRPDSGEYILEGKDLALPGHSLDDIRRRSIGFVFQDFRLMPQFTAYENILVPLLADKNKVNKEEEDYAHELIEMLGISHLQHQYPNTLSGGEKARVGICRALIRRPALLLADEPTGQLDTDNAAHVATFLQQVNKQLNTTIVMVTHDATVAQHASRIYTLLNGTLIEE